MNSNIPDTANNNNTANNNTATSDPNQETTNTPTSTPATRTGKIARLPRAIRQQLNERLADGVPQQHLLAWLNENQLVRDRIEDFFDGRPITAQNLSDWKRGGFLDWERHQDARALARDFLAESEEVGEETGGEVLLDRAADGVALVLLRLLREAAATGSGPEQRRAVLEIARELARMRRGDHQRVHLRLVAERQEKPPRRIDHFDEDAMARTLNRLDKEYKEFKTRCSVEGEAMRAEYVTGTADGTLDPERRTWIEHYFEKDAENLRDANVEDLPGFDRGREEVAGPIEPEPADSTSDVKPAAKPVGPGRQQRASRAAKPNPGSRKAPCQKVRARNRCNPEKPRNRL